MFFQMAAKIEVNISVALLSECHNGKHLENCKLVGQISQM